jgi:hypothetical protein
MNVDCEGLTRRFFAFCKGLSTGGQRAEKIATATAPLRGSKSVAFTPVVLLLLPPVPILVKLTLEFVPLACWFSHVRAHVKTEQGNRVRRQISHRAQEVCARCGRRGQAWPVDCRAVWHDDDTKHVQTLVGLIGICPACHAVKHLGLAAIAAYVAEAQARFARVHEETEAEMETSLTHVWRM